MREDRSSPNDAPLDRAIDQVLREMVTEDPPAGLSTKVRWLLLQRSAGRTGSAADIGAGTSPVAGPSGSGRRWMVPASSAVAVLLVTALLWVLKPSAPGPDVEETARPGVAGTMARGGIAGGPEAAIGAAPSAGPAGGVASKAAARSTRAAAGRRVAPDEWQDDAATAAGLGTGIGAAVALGALGDEEEAEDPRFARLVVRPLPAPTGPALTPVQMHDMTIREITIAPIEVVPLDPGAKTNPEKVPNREERR